MSKNIILCFDGTSNQPEDADQDTLFGVKDDSITNIFKLHLLFGGDLSHGRAAPDQLSLYYSGVGTYGGRLKRIYNALFAPENKDVGRIIRAAAADLSEHYENGDQVFLFGFSRGAAIARRFAAVVKQFCPEIPSARPIRFLGVFDTVASIGAPNLSSRDRPVSDVVFENGTISPNIAEALHLVALDEKRKAFQPTLMNQDDRVTEIWFSGAHSDVGGGYRYDGLSDVTLQFMLEELARRNLGIRLFAPETVDYDAIARENPDIDLDYDDIVIQPNPLGRTHQQERSPLSALITLDDRLLCVNSDDRPNEAVKPFVHRAVIERVLADPEYRPRSLRRTPHRVWNAYDHTPDAAGLRDHLLIGQAALRTLAAGESSEVVVHANLLHNRSGILVEKGSGYVFTSPVVQGEVWYDASIACGPQGWTRDEVSAGLKEVFIRFKEDDRRVPRAQWFELIGGVGTDDQELFRVLEHPAGGAGYVPSASGELVFFANDLPRYYANNLGCIRVRVQRLAAAG